MKKLMFSAARDSRKGECRKPVRNLLRKFMPAVVSIFTSAAVVGGCCPVKKPVCPPVERKCPKPVRKTSIPSIISIAYTTPVRGLIKKLKSRNQYVRRLAITLLEDMEDKSVNVTSNHKVLVAYSLMITRALLVMLRDDVRAVRKMAARALRKIVRRNSDSDDKKFLEIVPDLIKALNNKDSYVRMYVAMALGETKDKRAVPALRKLAKNDPDRQVRGEAAYAISQIYKKGYGF